MSRRKRSEFALSKVKVPRVLIEKVKPPLAVVLGSPAEVVNLLAALPGVPATCYQMDLHQGDRLREELAQEGISANVVVSADLWDLPAEFQSAVYMPARGGERELKLDMVEQAYHVLRDRGTFLLWSPYQGEEFFPALLKKIFGKIHTPPHDAPGDVTSLLWCTRDGERPRRRHEVTFQVRIKQGTSCRFISRPGTFCYGQFDNGARAFCEVMEVEPGDRVLDLGCGVGTNGVFASQRAGEGGHIAFVDSNARACALTEMNARSNGVANFTVFPTSRVEGPQADSFDVIVANPPYFAQSAIAHLFIRRAKELLTPQGRFFVVTRQPQELAEVLMEVFGEAEVVENRGYAVFCV